MIETLKFKIPTCIKVIALIEAYFGIITVLFVLPYVIENFENFRSYYIMSKVFIILLIGIGLIVIAVYLIKGSSIARTVTILISIIHIFLRLLMSLAQITILPFSHPILFIIIYRVYTIHRLSFNTKVIQYYEAKSIYKKASIYRNAVAQYKVGYMYYKGHGFQQNFKEAKEWFKKAAAHGNQDAKDALKQFFDEDYM